MNGVYILCRNSSLVKVLFILKIINNKNDKYDVILLIYYFNINDT